MTPFLSYIVVYGTMIALVVVVIAFAKRGENFTTTASAPRWARWPEGAVALLFAGVVWYVAATNRASYGVLRILDEMPSQVIGPFVMVTGFAAGLILCSALLVTRNRALAGLLLSTAALITYGFFLNGPFPFSMKALAEAQPNKVELTLDVDGVHLLEGADLWVNGVHLGKTPVQLTADEFKARVPQWDAVPPEMEGETTVINRNPFRGPTESGRDIWTEVKVPTGHGDSRTQRSPYFMRAEYAGEQALFGGSTGSSGSGDSYTLRARASFAIQLPEREARLDDLLDQARLNDYRVNENWLAAFESFGSDGLERLRRLAESQQVEHGYEYVPSERSKETELLAILDTWADARYGVTNVQSADDAWRVLERIMDDAKERGFYSTYSVAGWALEHIAPKLDPERLAQRACRELKERRQYGFVHGNMPNGEYHFAVASKPNAGHFRGGAVASHTEPDNAFGPCHAVLAHAVWRVDGHLDDAAPGDNPIERSVTAALLRKAYPLSHYSVWLQGAAQLGGPDFDRLVIRALPQPESLPGGRTFRANVGSVYFENGWNYVAAVAKSDGVEAMMADQVWRLEELAEAFFSDGAVNTADDLPDFIFDGAPDLAERLWPAFKHATATVHDTLKLRWSYLTRMGAGAETDRYINEWREVHASGEDNNQLIFAIDQLDELPTAQAVAIAKGILDELRDDPGAYDHGHEGGEIVQLKQAIRDWKREREFVQRLEEIDPKQWRYTAEWLELDAPWHPAVPKLATHDNPEFRSMAVAALQAHPTPEHQKLLAELLNDPNENVRARAKAATEVLEKLRNTPPGKFASNPEAFTDRSP